jgi:hypothetical protein
VNENIKPTAFDHIVSDQINVFCAAGPGDIENAPGFNADPDDWLE